MTGPHVVVDADGAAAVGRAVATGERTAIWVGKDDDPELNEFVSEISRRVQEPPAPLD